MSWWFSSDLSDYFKRVVPFLEEQEAANGLALGCLLAARKNPPSQSPFLAYAEEAGQVSAAALFIERNLVLSHGWKSCVPNLAAGLVTEVERQGHRLPGVVGPCEIADEFAQAYSQAEGLHARVDMNQRIYEIRFKVVPPVPVPFGRYRLMSRGDFEIVTDWMVAFYEESWPDTLPTEEAVWAQVTSALSDLSYFIWEVDGAPVAMARLTRPTRNGLSVSYVYTSPEHRRKGYASALTAAVTLEAFRRGKIFCTLYTDAANPTSNSIYTKLGYRPIAESKHYLFSPTEGT